ncbi:hypothetical protein LshimejAT787_0106930 [Lyophyllum shimeji]|uniref:Uncharacterized protein n=1 Tax=Lyophyllum shimeji TaxID=47721 RepID=A0A9P3PE39_LYOSH|nr:hypothetical protein LshimejAT787_0106930 [Lyophyllum shimeji]
MNGRHGCPRVPTPTYGTSHSGRNEVRELLYLTRRSSDARRLCRPRCICPAPSTPPAGVITIIPGSVSPDKPEFSFPVGSSSGVQVQVPPGFNILINGQPATNIVGGYVTVPGGSNVVTLRPAVTIGGSFQIPINVVRPAGSTSHTSHISIVKPATSMVPSASIHVQVDSDGYDLIITTPGVETRNIVLRPWTKFSRWKAEWKSSDYEIDVNYDYPTDMTVTDDQNKTERYEVFVDGVSVGKTSDVATERSKHCGLDADACIAKGWAHGTFRIPAGKHKISIKLIGNDIDWSGWWYFAGQYKIAKACT